ncbi:hypothetical protein TRAPUB_11992 [Trametes pubescens]|uniref:Uncharacterized protein n=1 Tax=Trametes pubescens TaxID=154538 RepID=A0A1M2VVA3_TRAPU|nr:hypothetical protein TRAPUB_11992 [Trametes pubescens]
MARLSNPASNLNRRRTTARAETFTNAASPSLTLFLSAADVEFIQNAMTARESPADATPAYINTVPTYNQPVLIQYRADIWIPGVVTRHFYNQQYACLATEVEFCAADGSRTRTGFLERDIRPAA